MNYSSKIQKLRPAFTLIELLVVIAIISLLVSILLPSLRQAKELAMEAQCKSGFHNIGIALSMYSSENNSRVPDVYWTNPGYCGHSWMEVIFPEYIDDQDIFRCVAAKDESVYRKGEVANPTDESNIYRFEPLMHYGIGMNAYSSVGLSEPKLDDMTSLDQTYYLLDSYGDRNLKGKYSFYLMPFDWYGTPIRDVADRHRDGANILYFDQHVGWDEYDTIQSHAAVSEHWDRTRN